MARNRKRLSKERAAENARRARWQRRNEARALRCRSEILKRPRPGREATRWTLTAEQAKDWTGYYGARGAKLRAASTW